MLIDFRLVFRYFLIGCYCWRREDRNNVTIVAGSVVVKDISDSSVAVGNPAKVIKTMLPIK